MGPGHVMGGVAYVFSNIEAPGVIAHHQLGRIVLGEMDGTISDPKSAFADACCRAASRAEMAQEIRTMLWRKICVDRAHCRCPGVDAPAGEIHPRNSRDGLPLASASRGIAHTAGRELELDAMHGYAVELGMRRSIPTPTMFLVYAALKPYIGGPPS